MGRSQEFTKVQWFRVQLVQSSGFRVQRAGFGELVSGLRFKEVQRFSGSVIQEFDELDASP
ncbi:MAG TPA: hypothetical protein DDY13_01595 [Cytophagales bacterium]|nr:hypothetical protein [Cytophagales bacterium]